LKTLKTYLAAGAALLALCLASGSALASILIAPSVSGHITAISGVSAVTVDGHLYIIRAGSPAVSQIAQFTVGQVVDIYLDGPATTSASEVIGINQHTGQ
jgi:hypothetical protein